MDFIFYEGIIMSAAKLRKPRNTKKSNLVAEIIPYTPEMKAPDCVFQTIVRRMDELNKEILNMRISLQN